MKAKVSRGAGFRGVLDYALDQGHKREKQPELVGGNMAADTSEDLAREFGAVRGLRSDIKKPVWHCSLSCPAGERLTSEQWAEAGRRHMEQMGLDPANHQYVLVRHNDTDHDHVHLIANRVGLDGKVWLGQWEAKHAINSTQQIERDMGLTLTAGLEPDHRPKLKTPSKGEIEMAIRTGEQPPRLVVQNVVREAMQDRPHVVEFIERLDAAGVRAVPNIASTGRMNGFSFERDGVAFKASQLGDDFKWASLAKEIDYEQDRDAAYLAGIKAAHQQRAGREGVAGDLGPDQPGVDRDGAGRLGRGDRGPGAEHDQSVDRDAHGLEADHGPARHDQGRGGEAVAAGSGRSIEADRDAQRHDDGMEGRRGAAPADDGRPAQARQDRSGDDEHGGRHADETVEHRRVEGLGDRADRRGAFGRVLDLAGTQARPGADAGADRNLGQQHRGGDAVAKHVAAKREAWDQQHAALNAPAYRLTLIGRGEHDGRNWNIGKGKGDEPEKFHTADEVRAMIPALARQNARGFDVYLTPIDQAHHYVLVDDMTPQKLDRMKTDGYQPTLVQQSSANNLQAVLKIDRQDRKDEQSLANNVVQTMNQTYGDPHLSGVVHPFRMAGFSNKKPGRANAFTKVLESQGGHVDPKADQALEDRREAVRQKELAAAVQVREQRLDKTQIQAMDLPQWDKNAAKIYADQVRDQKGLAAKQGWTLDWSVVDYRASKALLVAGADEATIARTVREFSPGLADRKHNPEDYAARTVQKAAGDLNPAEQAKREASLAAIAQRKVEQQRQEQQREAEAAREREAEAQQQRQRRMSMGRSR